MQTEPEKKKTPDDAFASDLVYGVLSIIDQFGGVLRERGREYRESREGQALHGSLKGIYETIGGREKEVLQVVLSSLDGLLKTVRDLDETIGGSNGDAGNGRRD